MRVLGIILLALLGLVLLLLLLALFFPITYRIRGSYHNRRPDLRASVFGLAFLLGCGLDIRGEDTRFYLRILGIKFHRFENTSKGRTSRVRESEASADEEVTDDVFKDADVGDDNPIHSEEFLEEAEASSGFFTRVRECFTKVKTTARSIMNMIRNWKKTIGRLIELIRDKTNQNALKTVGTRALSLLKILMPRRLKLQLQYSTGSPDTTGQLLGVLAMFPLGYRNRWNITPDFTAEEFYAEADFDIRGHIFGIQLLMAVLGIILDKDCRKIYNKIS
jgi:hypothetical protein